MASLTQWTWVWANSGRWWRTESPGVLQSMGLQRVRHSLATEQQKQGLEDWEIEIGLSRYVSDCYLHSDHHPHPSQSVVWGPAASASLGGCLLEMNILRPHPRPPDSEPASWQDLQVTHGHITTWEVCSFVARFEHSHPWREMGWVHSLYFTQKEIKLQEWPAQGHLMS